VNKKSFLKRNKKKKKGAPVEKNKTKQKTNFTVIFLHYWRNE